MKARHLLLSTLMGGAMMLSGQAFAGGAIGGDCCADLEERVAELEATVARKGNRKVSLKIHGLISRALAFEDGDVSIYNPPVQISRIRFSGGAKINQDLYAGYYIELGIDDDGNGVTAPGSGLFQLRHNDMFIGSKTFGKISIGQGSTASDKTAEADLSGTGYVASGALNNYHILSNLDGFSFTERVRYDTPTIAGFKVSTSWQDNESWDVAATYGGKLGDFALAARISYYEEGTNGTGDGVTGSASLLHVPTGLSLTFAGADSTTNVAKDLGDATDGLKYWYVKAGLQRKFLPIGKTAISVDYMDFSDGATEKWGIHAAQYIDAAAMQLYVSAWDAESDGTLNKLGDEQKVLLGATIHF